MFYGGSSQFQNYAVPESVPNDDVQAPLQNEGEEGEEEEGEEEGEEEEVNPSKVMTYDKHGRPLYPDNVASFSNFLGGVARDKVPITHEDWRKFEKEQKTRANDIWQHILVNLVFKFTTQNKCIKIANYIYI